MVPYSKCVALNDKAASGPDNVEYESDNMTFGRPHELCGYKGKPFIGMNITKCIYCYMYTADFSVLAVIYLYLNSHREIKTIIKETNV